MRAISRIGLTGWTLVVLAGLMLCLSSADASPQEKRRLVLGTASTYGTFDPHVIDDPGQNLIRMNFYDSLLRWVGAPPRLELWLAVGHEMSPEGQTHTFRLREDARFHNGRRNEETRLPAEIDYAAIAGLTHEARQRLIESRPGTLGQASRLPGITAATLSILLVHLRRRARAA
jgi:ABC-type transport system substrate-binding protein